MRNNTPCWEKECQIRNNLVAVTGELRLFNKNIGDCQIERLCIIPESAQCWYLKPVQPGEGPVNSGGNYDPLKVAYYVA